MPSVIKISSIGHAGNNPEVKIRLKSGFAAIDKIVYEVCFGIH
jgi:hypothetical protein